MWAGDGLQLFPLKTSLRDPLLVGWMVDLLVGWMVGRSVGWSVVWSVIISSFTSHAPFGALVFIEQAIRVINCPSLITVLVVIIDLYHHIVIISHIIEYKARCMK